MWTGSWTRWFSSAAIMNQVTIEPLFSGLLKRHDPLVANDGDRGLGTFSRALAGRSRAWRGYLLLQQVKPWQHNFKYAMHIMHIYSRKFSHGGATGHSTREGHHVDGPWGTKGRHHQDSKRLRHSPGDLRWRCFSKPASRVRCMHFNYRICSVLWQCLQPHVRSGVWLRSSWTLQPFYKSLWAIWVLGQFLSW